MAKGALAARIGKFLKKREILLVVLIGILVGAVSIRYPSFIGVENFFDILNDTSILVIVSVAQLGVLLLGGIDLSVGSNMALTSIVVASMNASRPDLPMAALIAMSLLLGALLGAFNGALIAYLKIPSIISTLGTISIYRGMTFLYSNGYWINSYQMSDAFKMIPRGVFAGISSLIWYAIAASAVLYVFYNRVKTGREFYAVGGNSEAAGFAGVSVRKIQFLAFVLSGALAGLGGTLYVARYAIAQSGTATGFEFQTVAACVIGGVSTSGGLGNVPGVVLGAIFIGILNNALPVIKLSPFYQMSMQGAVILLAVIFNTLGDRNTKTRIIKRRTFNEAA
jgi:rhamnose transport system permease protein